jgi:hypothetical protein
MADTGNSTRSNRNEPVYHSLRYAYVLIVPQQQSQLRSRRAWKRDFGKFNLQIGGKLLLCRWHILNS